LPTAEAANALRQAINEARDLPIKQETAKLLKPMNDDGKRISFRWVWSQHLVLALAAGVDTSVRSFDKRLQVENIRKDC